MSSRVLRPKIIFYVVVCLLFFIIEPIAYLLLNWIDRYNFIAGIVFGHSLMVFFLLFGIIFCIVWLSSLIVLFRNIKKDKLIAVLPCALITLTVAIYLIIPHNDRSIWFVLINNLVQAFKN